MWCDKLSTHSEYRRQVVSNINALRKSIDRSLSTANFSVNIDYVAEIISHLEKIRVKFAVSVRFDNESAIENSKILIDGISGVIESLEWLDSQSFFTNIADNFRYSAIFMGKDSDIFNIRLSKSMINGPISVKSALHVVLDGCRFIQTEISSSHPEEFLSKPNKIPDTELIARDLNNLKKLIPDQKIGPIKFIIKNNIICLDHNPSDFLEGDRKNISFAQSEILNNGAKLIDSLEKSNCDKRLIETATYLQAQIKENNSIRIGISNINFGIISEKFKSELSDALQAMLQSHHLSVNMYIAQFPDWTRFSQNAAELDITAADIESINKSANYIIKFIKSNKEIAEPDVLKALKEISQLTRNPSSATRRAALAVIRTLENLFSKIFHYALVFFEETMKETFKTLSKITSKAISVTIIGLALGGATELINLSPKMKDILWIKNAIEIVQRQMKKLEQ